MNDRNRYILENEEIEDPEEDEVEEVAPPDFNEGDLCVTLVPIKRSFGVVPEGTSVEVKRKFIRNKKVHYDVEKLPCECGLTLKINQVPIDELEDYENRYPSL